MGPGLSRRQVLGTGLLAGGAWLTAHLIGHRPMGGGPSPFLGQVGASALQPDIRSRGAPLPQERHDDRIVLGGFQGNVDIEDLASRRQ